MASASLKVAGFIFGDGVGWLNCEWEYVMGQSKPTEETIEKLMGALLKAGRPSTILPELLAAILTKMHQRGPKMVRAVVEAIIDDAVAALPEDKRQEFWRKRWHWCGPTEKKLRRGG
jgi:hypothetical protein